MQKLRALLEARQVTVYFGAIVVAVVVAMTMPGSQRLEVAINPTLAAMLFLTFFQVPFADLRHALSRTRFLVALLLTDFVAIPLLVALLFLLLPHDPLIRLGVAIVLLAPCIDYVVTFAHLGEADAQALLAATPVLLVVQMLLLPFFLPLFLGANASGLIAAGPFLHAFLWLIAAPLLLSALLQQWVKRASAGETLAQGLGLLPVPATAVVLFVVVASMVPRLGSAWGHVIHVLPVYVLFALFAPCIGWTIGRLFQLERSLGRAVAFSAGTRNSLVILPLALALPSSLTGAMAGPAAQPVTDLTADPATFVHATVSAIIIAQTLVELVASLLYIRAIPRLTRPLR